jgi:hypothetical protein
MSLDVAIGLIGVIVTALVVVGMILITPRGVDEPHPAATAPSARNDVPGSSPAAAQRTPDVRNARTEPSRFTASQVGL